MTNYLHFVFILSLLSSVQASYGQFNYISPMPGSRMHHREAGIILRTGDMVNTASLLKPGLFSVSGSKSGEHTVRVKLAADQKSILIRPLEIFSSNETVTVIVKDGIRNSSGMMVQGITFQFQIRPEISSDPNESAVRTDCDHLPSFIINSVPGAFYDEQVFYWNHVADPAISECWMSTIVSSEGDSIYSCHDTEIGFDFKLNDNGYLTRYNKTDSCFDMLDSSYQVVKKFFMENGYYPNKHEFRVYPDGYHFMICYDDQLTDMTAYGGLPNALVTGLVIQHLDPNDDVIFEWRSWDHFQFTDAAADISLTASKVDYVHGNSLELDFDGNLLLSSRNLDEITKIDLATGAMIWRMGGENNEFTFIDNPDTPKSFSHQHHFRLLPNGHYSLFDNGNYQIPQRSSAKEFVLDQVNKTATLVWSYVHPPVNGYHVYGSALGSVQLLPNGNRLINWGQISAAALFADIPNFTEVDSIGNIVWEFRFTDSTYVTYRTHKFPWDRCNLIADSSLTADSITAIDVDLHWNDHTKFSGFTLEYKPCDSSSWVAVQLDTNFYQLGGLEMNTCYDWRVKSICAMYGDSFYTDVHQFITLNPVSVPESDNIPSYFMLYPNPAGDETELSFFSTGDCKAEVTVYNLSGAIVTEKILSAYAGMNRQMLDLKYLNTGAYIIGLILPDGVRYERLLIQ